MDFYYFRNGLIFKFCRGVQKTLDVSKYDIWGIGLDRIFHLLLPIGIYFILIRWIKPKKVVITLFIFILLKELNDFYIYYYFKDIKARYVLSSFLDLLLSFVGVLFIHFIHRLIARRKMI